MRETKRPIKYGETDLIHYALVVGNEPCYFEPASFREAITSKKRRNGRVLWMESISF